MRYGAPQILIDHWRERQGEMLLPLQSAAAQAGILGDFGNSIGDGSVLIAGPTSAGKSFCGELALARALVERRKAVLLVPYKSLAEEKYAELGPVYRRLGLRACIATADHPETDRVMSSGDFDVAVCVYEKFNRLLNAKIDTLAQLAVVVIDEIQLALDAERGPLLERILVKVRGYVAPPRIVGLSSPDLATALAGWLDLPLISESVRPRELRRGVVVGEKFHYRCYNSGREGIEQFALGEATPEPGQSVLAGRILNRLRRDSGQSLVFLSSRQSALESAFALASQTGWRRAERALERLQGDEPSHITRSLAQSLTRGVAFHTSDLTAEQRRIVEDGFRSGEIRVVFCTTTLALGVNLPADTVYIEPFKYRPGPVAGHHGTPRGRSAMTVEPLSVVEFDGIAGRAGRFYADSDSNSSHTAVSAEQPIARAVLLARNEFEHEALWRMYIEPRVGQSDIEVTLSQQDQITESATLALEALLCGLVSSYAELTKLFRLRRQSADISQTAEDCREALEYLQSAGLVTVSTDDETIAVTALARAGALGGLSLETMVHLRKFISDNRALTDREWIAAALGTPDARKSGALLGGISDSAAERQLYASAPDEAGRLVEFLAPESGGDGAFGARVRSFLALERWRSGAPARELERYAHITAARLAQLGETVAWLIGALADMCEAEDRSFAERERINLLRESLRRGLPAEITTAPESFTRHFNRGELAHLLSQYVTSSAELCARSARALSTELAEFNLGGAGAALEKISALSSENNDQNTQQVSTAEADTRTRKDVRMNTQAAVAVKQSEHPPRPRASRVASRVVSQPTLGMVPCKIEIDGSMQGERFVVRVDGIAATLTAKSFKYLLRLACARMMREDGWIYKDDIEVGFNQARYLYRMRNELQAGLPGYRWPVYENNRLGYYRLQLDPQALQINTDLIVRDTDFEIAETGRSLAEWQSRRLSA